MAKGSLNGVRKGKKGDSVYYTITGSNNKEKQGERQYVGEVANPKTMMQAAQRMKLAPAVNFYRAFSTDILNHSWQGVKYGARSHSEFMRNALNNNSGVFPFVNQGETKLVPARYLVSKGSIPYVEFFFEAGEDFAIICPTLSNATINVSVATWMQTLIENSNGFLKAGDQITLMLICKKSISTLTEDVETDWFPYTIRIVLDPTKDGVGFNTAADWLHSKGLKYNMDEQLVPYENGPLAGAVLGGCAIITSRPSVSKTSGVVTWLRSSSQMQITQEVEDTYFTQAAYDEAIRTYLPSSVNPSSGWYLNDGSLTPDNQQTPLAPGVVSSIRNQVVTLREQASFGKYTIRCVAKDLRKDGIIATPLTPSGTNYAEFQLYSLSSDGESPDNDTVIYKPAGLTIVAANSDEMADIMAFMGNIVTPDEAIAAMAAEGVTYTKGY